MTLYIEVLIIIVIALMLSIWAAWFFISRNMSIRRYKPENDRGYQGEENRKRLIAEGKPDPATTNIDFSRQRGSKGHNILPTTESNVGGEKSDSIGKTSKSNGGFSKRFRNPFRRRKS